MARPSKYKDTDLVWEKYGGGLNTVEDPIAIQDGQLHEGSKNFISRSRSVKWRPSIRGIKTTAVSASDLCKGAFEYLQVDGTSKKLAVYDDTLYEVNVGTGALTSRYVMGGSGAAYGTSFRDKAWVCNGAEVVKVENETAYQVGITPPSGASAAAVAGGSLADGTYQVYISYAREVNGTLVLYSSGQNLGTVTLGTGNNTVRVTSFAQSSDAQVGKRVIFLTDGTAGGVPYQYYTADNDATTTHDVTSNSSRNEAITYEAFAANSIRPGAFQFIHYHDNKLLGVIDNVVYYSRDGSTVYDFERFPERNVNEYPSRINCAFSIGEELYFSCPDANIIIWQPRGDMSQRFYVVDDRFAFRYPNTIDNWSGGAIGWTQDGIRIFDGTTNRFIDQDVSYFIKPEIREGYTGATTNHQPCGVVIRRDSPVTRTEYIISFRDTRLGNAGNNVRAALNLSELKLFGGTDMIAPWDYWETGTEFFIRDKDNNLYHFQNATTASTVYTEDAATLEDQYVYVAGGLFLSDATVPTHIVKSKQEIPNIKGLVRINNNGHSYLLVENNAQAVLRVVLRDKTSTSDEGTFSGGLALALFDISVFGQSQFSGESPQVQRIALDHTKLIGRIVHIEIEQSANDPSFEAYTVYLESTEEQDPYT